jgi:hypothetical protein
MFVARNIVVSSVFVVLVASSAAAMALGLAHCGFGAAQCSAGVDSVISFSGSVALPDSDIDSLVITACMDSDCWTTGGLDGGYGVSQVPDASSPTVRYSNVLTDTVGWTVTRLHSGLYDLKGGSSPVDPPTGSATSGTARITITSRGVVLYEKSVPNVACTQGPEVCGTGSETCDVRLP